MALFQAESTLPGFVFFLVQPKASLIYLDQKVSLHSKHETKSNNIIRMNRIEISIALQNYVPIVQQN